MSILAAQRLIWLHQKTSDLNTRKLFVMSCFLTCFLRFLSFLSITALNAGNFKILTSPNSRTSSSYHNDGDIEMFFEKACIVLFDFPDFPCISAYMLLSVLWAEAFIQSRRHWMSSVYFRRSWMVAYLIFNIFLYAIQMSLYSLLFLPSVNQRILTTLIYLALSTINLALPVMWIIVYFLISIAFAGFPFASVEAQLRLTALGRLGTIWTVARLSWGFIDLTSVVPMAIGLLSRSLQSLAENDMHVTRQRQFSDNPIIRRSTEDENEFKSVPQSPIILHFGGHFGDVISNSDKYQEDCISCSSSNDGDRVAGQLRRPSLGSVDWWRAGIGF
eukprot:gene4337-8630_t